MVTDVYIIWNWMNPHLSITLEFENHYICKNNIFILLFSILLSFTFS